MAIKAASPSGVCFIRPEISRVLSQYTLIRDVLEGEQRIKECGTVYLPMPNASDKSIENVCRYQAYKARAVFYNVARRTLNGLLGQIFMRDAIVKVPSNLEPLLKDIDGAGVSADQQTKRACQYALAYSRFGGYVDYPTSEGATVEQQRLMHPIVKIYAPWQIINWREEARGSKTVFTLVVIAESYCIEDDGFEVKEAGQIRVLKLENGIYKQQIWRENNPTPYKPNRPLKGMYAMEQEVIVKDVNGNPLTEIPFSFCGSENNDSGVDLPSYYDICSINVAHYRNSADYEESCFVVGQPTPVVTGLTKVWLEEVLKNKIEFGSRGGLPLPTGATAELLQAEPNTMIKEAMEAKERQMIALGAKLVQQKEVQITAFEKKIDNATETSTLANIAANVSAFYTWAFDKARLFVSASANELEYTLNKDFDISALTPEQQTQVITQWTSGAISFIEMRTALKKAGTAFEDDSVAKTSIDAEKKAEADRQISIAQASKSTVAA